ncbi:pirin family protein [Peribacillus sp. Hz7]|uniref:pirin family protein n=1 Tax=Peribacillus sp. Hz7 TaxID=3344873 RepID=UPI0035CC9EDF
MIIVQRADSRYKVNTDWLESNLSFSFGEYYDPDNIQFGPLRVLNDDTIQPNRGFGIHPHREAEIVSIVLQGKLKHEDSMGNAGILQFGDIQRMTAGTGILHSELNGSNEQEAKFLQLWFFPNEKQLTPSYEDMTYDITSLKNQWIPVVSHTPDKNVAKIHQDVTLYLSKPEKGTTLHYEQTLGRRMFLFVIEGEVNMHDSTMLKKRDAVRISEESSMSLGAKEDSFLLLIDLPGEE